MKKKIKKCTYNPLREQKLKKLSDCCINSNVEEVQNILLEMHDDLTEKELNLFLFTSMRYTNNYNSDKNHQIVCLLLDRGANVNFIDVYVCGSCRLFSPLQLAIAFTKPKLIVELLLRGANINNVVHECWYDEKFENAFDMLMHYCNFKRYDPSKSSALPFYLMLFRGATIDRQSKYKHLYNLYFNQWETEMLVYCLEKKELSQTILAFIYPIGY